MSVDNIIQIKQVLSNISFTDGTKLIEKISPPRIQDNNLSFIIYATKAQYTEAMKLRDQVYLILKKHLPSLQKISVVISNDVEDKSPAYQNLEVTKKKIIGVKNVILVIAGKGGVGKSTISIALSETLTRHGYKTGLLDADLYGPSIPIMLGIDQKPDIINNQMIPIQRNNIQILSFGFLVEKNTALAWRGAMISKAIHQLLMARWENLDYLIIDMPPGTGDIHITFIKHYIISGILAVTTPQLASTSEVEKSLTLYKNFGTKIIGIVENMSFLKLTSQEKLYPFGQGGGVKIANQFSIPLIAQIPLDPRISNSTIHNENISDIITFPWQRIIQNI